MAERDSYETNKIHPNFTSTLSDDQQFRLKKISEIRDYFVAEIKERELMSKRLSKYVASFDYFDKSLIFLSVTNDSISTASFATVIGAPVGNISANFSVAFWISTGIIKKLLKATRSRKKKHNKIVMLSRSKLSSIESKISKALINNENKHENFTTIIDEKKRYRELSRNIKKVLEWWIVKEVMRRKLGSLKKVKRIGINEVKKRN